MSIRIKKIIIIFVGLYYVYVSVLAKNNIRIVSFFCLFVSYQIVSSKNTNRHPYIYLLNYLILQIHNEYNNNLVDPQSLVNI